MSLREPTMMQAVEGLDSDEDDEDDEGDDVDDKVINNDARGASAARLANPDVAQPTAIPERHVRQSYRHDDELSALADEASDTDDSAVSLRTTSSSSSSGSSFESPPRRPARANGPGALPSHAERAGQGAAASLEARVMARLQADDGGRGLAPRDTRGTDLTVTAGQKHRRGGPRREETVIDDGHDLADDLEGNFVDSKPSRRSIWQGFCTRKELSRYLRNRRKTVRTTLCTMLGLYILGLLFATEGSLDVPSDQVPNGIPGQLRQGNQLRGATRKPPTAADREELRRSLPREALRAAGFKDDNSDEGSGEKEDKDEDQDDNQGGEEQVDEEQLNEEQEGEEEEDPELGGDDESGSPISYAAAIASLSQRAEKAAARQPR